MFLFPILFADFSKIRKTHLHLLRTSLYALPIKMFDRYSHLANFQGAKNLGYRVTTGGSYKVGNFGTFKAGQLRAYKITH